MPGTGGRGRALVVLGLFRRRLRETALLNRRRVRGQPGRLAPAAGPRHDAEREQYAENRRDPSGDIWLLGLDRAEEATPVRIPHATSMSCSLLIRTSRSKFHPHWVAFRGSP